MLPQPGMMLLLERGNLLEYKVPHSTGLLERVYRVRFLPERNLLICTVFYPTLPRDERNRLQYLAQHTDINAFLRDIPTFLKEAEFQVQKDILATEERKNGKSADMRQAK